MSIVAGLPIVFSSMTSGTCVVAVGTVTMIAHGTCQINATSFGNFNYLPASASQTVAPSTLNQTVEFITAAPQSAQIGGHYVPWGRASSGRSVSLWSGSPACSIEDGTVRFQSTGQCILILGQVGDPPSYFPAPNVSQAFRVATCETANAGPDLDIGCRTAGVLAADAPTTGQGSWSQLNGGNVDFADPSSATTEFSALTETTMLQWRIPCGRTDRMQVKRYDNVSAAVAGPSVNIGCLTSHNMQAVAAENGFGIWVRVSGTGTMRNPRDPAGQVLNSDSPNSTWKWTIRGPGCISTEDFATISQSSLRGPECAECQLVPLDGNKLVSTCDPPVAVFIDPRQSLTFGNISLTFKSIDFGGQSSVNLDAGSNIQIQGNTTVDSGTSLSVAGGAKLEIGGNLLLGNGTLRVVGGTSVFVNGSVTTTGSSRIDVNGSSVLVHGDLLLSNTTRVVVVSTVGGTASIVSDGRISFGGELDIEIPSLPVAGGPPTVVPVASFGSSSGEFSTVNVLTGDTADPCTTVGSSQQISNGAGTSQGTLAVVVTANDNGTCSSSSGGLPVWAIVLIAILVVIVAVIGVLLLLRFMHLRRVKLLQVHNELYRSEAISDMKHRREMEMEVMRMKNKPTASGQGSDDAATATSPERSRGFTLQFNESEQAVSQIDVHYLDADKTVVDSDRAGRDYVRRSADVFD